MSTTTETIPLVASVPITFSWSDYGIFLTMLTISVLVGIYFGCFGSKQSTTAEYLMGGKTMHFFPIAMSLVASHISGVTLLGVPADTYRFGAGYWWCVPAFLINVVITNYVYLPVLFDLGITSVYEYLEPRFDSRTRVFASLLFTIYQILFLPIVVYIPALAFAAATGMNLYFITPVICGVCIFYTTIGGLKAVVWTDTLQFSVTLGAVATVLYLGVKAAGGVEAVWRKAIEGNRLSIFGTTLDVTSRDSLWAPLIGLTCLWISQNNTNQSCIQKLLSVSTLYKAKMANIFYAFGMSLVKSASIFTGLVIYAKYSNCDPFQAKQLTRNDQLLPYYVMDVAGGVPGLAGLFIAGVFSAGLSTLSAHLNCLAGTIYEDFIEKLYPKLGLRGEQSKSYILKGIVVVAGVVCTSLVFVFQHLGGILPLSIAFHGMTNGPMLGMFTLGILVRRANAKGAFWGGIAGSVIMSCLIFPTKILESQGIIRHTSKSTLVDDCPFNVTRSIINQTIVSTTPSGLSIFRISYYYYTFFGFLITMIIGLFVSYLTKADSGIINEELLSPLVRKKQQVNLKTEPEYKELNIAMKIITEND